MNKVYKIVTFNLLSFNSVDKKLYTFELMPELESRQEGGREHFYYTGTNEQYMQSNLWELSTTKKENAIDSKEKFMPYFADVTEDVPSQYKFSRRTFKNCQLLTEKHGGYLQFFHKESGEILRIALNSNFYIPLK